MPNDDLVFGVRILTLQYQQRMTNDHGKWFAPNDDLVSGAHILTVACRQRMTMVHGFCRMTTCQQRARVTISGHDTFSTQLTGQDFPASRSVKPSTCKLRAGRISQDGMNLCALLTGREAAHGFAASASGCRTKYYCR
jgi:hypothetical protein